MDRFDYPTTRQNDDCPSTAAGRSHCALFVDLDGTLIQGDLLRSAFVVLCVRPLLWPASVGWLLCGRAWLKDQLSRRISIDAAGLSYRPEVLELIHRHKAAGEKIILATATAERWARDVAEHLGCFDDVLSSSRDINLKGANKLYAIQSYCRRSRIRHFGYVGDSTADLPIWRVADSLFVVPACPRVLKKVQDLHRPFEVVDRSRGTPSQSPDSVPALFPKS